MPKLKYIGTSHFREINAADFKSVGVKDQTKVVWDRDERGDRPDAAGVHEVSQAAADWLMEHEPGDWQISTDDVYEEDEDGDDDDDGEPL